MPNILSLLQKRTTVDDYANKTAMTFNALLVGVGLFIVTITPAPPRVKEEQTREWVRRKEDEETPGMKSRRFIEGRNRLLADTSYMNTRHRRWVAQLVAKRTVDSIRRVNHLNNN